MKTSFAIILTCFCAITSNADDERIWWSKAKINGKPVRLCFDTGTSVPVVLYSATAQRLGLKVTPADYQPDPGRFAFGITEMCDLNLGVTNILTSLSVGEMPKYLKWREDGMLGWPALRANILSLDAAKDKIKGFASVPKKATAWTKLCVQTNLNILGFEVVDQNGKKANILVDTGIPYGIKLSPQKWQEWKAAHTNQPMTIEAYYTPSLGAVIAEETWAHEITLGPLVLTDVPVMEADSTDVIVGSSPQSEYEATLGLAALKRLDNIIDGKNGVAYLQSKKSSASPYQHNRLGADFVPKNNSKNDDLVAHVAAGSPASEAGIRDGDVLLKINGYDEARWRTDTNPPPKVSAFMQPARTKVELTLKRGDEVFKTTAVLRNILPPRGMNNSN